MVESFGGTVQTRYAEWIDDTKEDTRTPEEVITSISAKLDLLGEA